MDFRRLRYFVAIAEQNSIGKAAQNLGISQPALSRQLRLLEEEFGKSLFIRHGHGVTLTNAGVKLLEQCTIIFDALENAERAIADTSDSDMSQEVVLGLNGAPSRYLCPLLVGEFCANRPNLSLEFSVASSEALQAQILDDKLDMAILSNPPTVDGLIITPLINEDVHMIRAPIVDSSRQHPLSINDFAELQFTTTAYMKGRAAPVISELFQLHGLTPRDPVIINSIPMTREVLLSRIGFCVGPPSNYGPELAAGDLVSLPVPGLSVVRALAIRRDRVVPDAFVELECFLREKIRTLIADGTWPAARIQQPQELGAS